ncbi:MAG: SLC13 family permease, partial [Pseudomonadota bacterium]|nr:SLC13 family permease [Pseudomonadota bacterium]
LEKKNKDIVDNEKEAFESGRIYLVEITIDSNNPLIGKKFVSGILSDIKEIAVNVILRDGEKFLPPFEDVQIRANDKLVLEITKNQLTEKLKSNDKIFNSLDNNNSISERGILIEASVTPRSFFIGRNLTQTNFEAETNCKIIGIKNDKKFLRNSPRHQRMEAGHILLIKGEEEDIKNLRGKKEIFPIEWSAIYLPAKQFILRSRIIFAFTILSAATGLLNITVAALLGVILMLLTNVLTIRDAISALDTKIFLLVASSIMLSTALQETGGALYIADLLKDLLINFDIIIVLSLFFIFIAIITNFLSNNATAVLFAPIAINLASDFNIQPEPFIYCLIFAANCSFATPIGYKTNLLVMGPGNYQFKDYLTSGIPLVLLMWLSYTIMISVLGF